ncbi:hypothetical protein NA57DRAFT_12920, partial [Rhizodiscina lignyota]
DSKTLAEAAQRDTSSMKSLAILTAIFLPPTAVATIFAMPFFDWTHSGSGPVVNHKFWIYWATAIPLTIATVTIWWVWIRRESDFKRKLMEVEAKLKEM